MQLPDKDTSAQTHYLAGRYTIRAASRAGLADAITDLEPANDEVRVLGRQVEDLEAPAEDAICDRDQVDHQLDDTVRLMRNQLLSGGVHLEKQEPYASIVPEGIGEYIDATLDDQVAKFSLLISRLESNLAVDHPVRTTFVPRLRASLLDWNAAVTAVNAAREAQDGARRKLELSIGRWETAMHTVHATLVARLGSKSKADRFFRKAKSRPKKKAEAPAAEAPAAETASPPAPASEA